MKYEFNRNILSDSLKELRQAGEKPVPTPLKEIAGLSSKNTQLLNWLRFCLTFVFQD